MNRILIIFFITMSIFLEGCKEKNIEDFNAVKIKDSILFVEKAITEKQKQTGLMFRTSLKTNWGMIFLFNPPTIPYFYMKNTAIPLDIIFISKDKQIVSIKSMQPFDEKTHHYPDVPVAYALEVNQGWSLKHNISVGDKVIFIKLSKGSVK